MNYREALQMGNEILNNTPSTSPSLDAEVLLRFVSGLSKEDLISQRLQPVDPLKINKFQELLKERKKGMPVAYLTGTKEFYNLKFLVNRHVLIPRPETETLVDRIIFELKGRHNLRLLDIGTGSGCIIISLAKNLSVANHYYGSDESARALAVAEQNAGAHKVKVSFIRSDLTHTTGTDYDVIIANLPYLTRLEDPSTEFEPKTALLAKKGGLELYEKLFNEIASGPANKRPLLYLEFGHDHAPAITNLVHSILPEYTVEIFKDLAGIPRFARLWHKPVQYL